MKVAITGTSGLAKNIKDTLEGTAIDGSWIEVVTPRIEDIINNDTKWYGFSQVDVFINFDEGSIKDEPEDEAEDEPLNENLYRSVSELELSVRSINCLQNAKIETIGDLVQRSEQEMLKTKNFGRKSLTELQEKLGELDLHFGMDIQQYLETE